MSLSRRIRTQALVALSLTGLASAPLAAQARELFQWSGRVDRETFITMRGGSARATQGRYQAHGNLRLEGALPRHDGRVMVRLERGSADVDVVQQPSARNDYTAVIRVRENRRNDERVRIAALWRADHGRGDRGNGNGGWGNVDDRRDDDRWERRDDARDLGTRTAFRWSGTVDGEVEIRLQGRRASYQTLSGASIRDARLDAEDGVPREGGVVSIVTRHGRGSVSVVEQPDARNGWTTIIRIRDPQGGASHYAFDVQWRDGDRRGW